MIVIKSSQNKFLKQLNKLKNKKEREKTGLFVVEGERAVKEITENVDILYCVISENYSDFNINCKNIYMVNNDLFKKISDTVSPQGILAVCRQLKYNIDDILKKENSFFVILENVMDPGNLGTIIRTADAAGADAVFLSKGCAELYNNKVIRSTMGSIFHIPVIEDVNILQLIRDLKNNSVLTVSAHLKGKIYPYDLNLSKSCAIVIGNEANGLTDEVSNITDIAVKIPMLGKAESINASIACSILMYEVVRQRM